MAETGLDLANSFPSAKHFTSWLGLAPNKKITGGKVISNKTQKKKHRLANAFRHAANAVGRQTNNPLSDFFKRLAYRKNRPVAITATARKIAVIVYHMLTKKEGFNPMNTEDYKEILRNKKVKHIQRTIQQLGISAKELNIDWV